MMNDDDVVVARASGRETVEELQPGALDALFERLDAGEVEMTVARACCRRCLRRR